MNEVVIGLDPHKSSNTIVSLDRDENVLARRRFDNDADGLPALLDAVADFPDRQVATRPRLVRGSRHLLARASD